MKFQKKQGAARGLPVFSMVRDIFHWANRRWPRLCHSYFPVELRVDVAALPERFVLALHPHGPCPLSASLLRRLREEG